MDFGQFLTNVSRGVSSVAQAVFNPIGTITGFTQGVVRPAVGGAFLQGANTPTIQKVQASTSKVSINPAPANPVLSTIQGLSSAVARGATNVIDSITGKITQVKRDAAVASKVGEVQSRLIDTGLNAIDAFVQNLVGRGNRENPRPADITTDRFSSAIGSGGYAASPGVAPAGQTTILGIPFGNAGTGATAGTDSSVVIERETQGQPNYMPIFLVGGLALAGILLLRKR